MKTLRFPLADLEASRIAYGCMEIGGGWNKDPLSDATRRQAVQVVKAALDEGINFFDHADIYCMGKSEQAFADIWKESPGLRENIILQSKCGIIFAGDPTPDMPHRFDFSAGHILASVDGSLKRLQTDYLDILLLHRPDPLVEPEEVAEAFDQLQRSGKVRYFGVSNHTAAQMELLSSFLNQPLVTNQVELNILHAQMLDAGVVFNQTEPDGPYRNEGTLEYCRREGIILQAWSPLARGWLSGRLPENPGRAVLETSQLVARLAQEKGVSCEAIVIAWLLRHPAGIQPIIGTTNLERIHAACEADTVDLSREDWYRLFTAGRGGPLP